MFEKSQIGRHSRMCNPPCNPPSVSSSDCAAYWHVPCHDKICFHQRNSLRRMRLCLALPFVRPLTPQHPLCIILVHRNTECTANQSVLPGLETTWTDWRSYGCVNNPWQPRNFTTCSVAMVYFAKSGNNLAPVQSPSASLDLLIY